MRGRKKMGHWLWKPLQLVKKESTVAQTNVIAVQRWEDGNFKIIVYNDQVGL